MNFQFNNVLRVYFAISDGGRKNKDLNMGLFLEYMRFVHKIIREILHII